MLATLYANGEGVKKNKPLALRFGCEADLHSNVLMDLEQISVAPAQSKIKFAYCDEVGDTFTMNRCAEVGEEIAAQKRADALAKSTSHWPQAHQAAFKLLQQAHEDYLSSLVRDETSQQGSIHILREFHVAEVQHDKFLASVKQFERGDLPHGNASDYAKADAELNRLYRIAISEGDGDIKADGIQRTERVWLKYRDAWVAFAKLHYPGSEANAWLTLLTKERSIYLAIIVCDNDEKDAACTPEIRSAPENQY